jgi:hypothetical protein
LTKPQAKGKLEMLKESVAFGGEHFPHKEEVLEFTYVAVCVQLQ